MADLPILFSAPMIRAILREIEQPGTGKSQTRRILAAGNVMEDISSESAEDMELQGWLCFSRGDALCAAKVSRWAGDRLWVREAWHAARSLDTTRPRDIPRDADIEYAATSRSYAEIGLKGKLRQSMFMPRWASRLTLYVTDVKVERLQDISEADAIAEGIEKDHAAGMLSVWGWRDYLRGDSVAKRHFAYPCDSYRTLWDAINGPGAWDVNPCVVAYTFTPCLGNIDTLPATLQEAA